MSTIHFKQRKSAWTITVVPIGNFTIEKEYKDSTLYLASKASEFICFTF